MNADPSDGILGQVNQGGESSPASKRIEYPLDLTFIGAVFPQLMRLLRQARSEYFLGRYEESFTILVKKCLPEINAKIEQLTIEAEDVLQYLSLGGSAYTLSAQLSDRLGYIDSRKDASEAAVQYFELLKKRRPLTGSEMNEYGISLHLRGDVAQANLALEEAAQVGSASADAYLFLGLNAFGKGDFPSAEKYLNAADNLDPVDLEIVRLETRVKVAQALGGEAQADLLPLFFELSDLLWQTNSTDEALEVFQHILELDPNNLLTMIRKTMLLGALDRYQEALDQAEQALQLDPDNVTLISMQGMALFFLDRNEEAIAAFERAHILGLDEVEQLRIIVLPLQGRTLVTLGRYEEALPLLEQALQLNPNDLDVLESKARALMLLDRIDEGRVIYDQALQIDPQNIKLLISKGLALFAHNLFDEAEAALDQVAQLGIDSTPVFAQLTYSYLGMTLAALGRHEEAIAMLDKSLAINPADVEILFQKGLALDALSRYDEAIAVFDIILAGDPDNLQALERKLYSLIGAGRMQEAITISDEALELNPEGAAMYTARGVAQFALNQFTEAVESFDKALAIGLDEYPVVKQIAVKYKGRALIKANRFEQGLIVLEKALKSAPNDPEILDDLSMGYYLLGKYKESIKYFNKILRLDATKIDPYLYKAEALRQLGRYDEAMSVQDHGLKLDPENEMLLTARGYTLINLERDAEGEEVIDRALEKNPKNTWALSAKAWVRMRADDYKTGLAIIKKCVDLDAEYSWALAIYGTGLCDVAEYKKAIPLLKKASEIDTKTSWIVGNLGEAYYRLAQDTADKKKRATLLGRAVAAFTQASKLDDTDLAYLAWQGDCLFLQGEDHRDEANALYQEAIELGKQVDNPEASLLDLLGWCYYRLACQEPDEAEAMLTEAERMLVESLAMRREKPVRYAILQTKFRLALVIYLSGRYRLAVSEYESTVTLVRNMQEMVQRGLFDRARKDLAQEVTYAGCYIQESLRQYEKIMALLQVRE